LHAQYRQSPYSVEAHWREFFQAFDQGEKSHGNGNGNGNHALLAYVPVPSAADSEPYINGNGNGGANGAAAFAPASSRGERLLAAAALQGRVYQLVNAYRVRGHLFAKIDPLG